MESESKSLTDAIASVHNQPATHPRFNREVWAFKSDFTGALAKWLVKQSPYPVPDNLAQCLSEFESKLDTLVSFDTLGMAQIELSTLTPKVYAILETIPCIMALNEPKSGHNCNIFVTRHSAELNPDDDFIDIMAVAQNITCEFATQADSDAYLEEKQAIKGG